MNMITDLVRMWLTRSIKPFVFTGEFDSRLPYEECEQLGLYVHIPFCRSVCNFCPYCKVEYSKEWCDRYIDALIQEIHLVGGRGEEKKRVTSLYFGGGTPALAAGRLKEIIDALGRYYDITEGIGVELHPSDVVLPVLRTLRDAGVTKLSIGIQSFQGRHQAVLGREAAAPAALAAALAAVPFETVSMDFIFALPGQTLDELKADIDTAFANGANHIALYPFIDFTFTDSLVSAMPKKEKRRLMDAVTAYCQELGCVRNSIWTFAQGESVRYSSMTRETFLGFGCSAATLLREQFKVNTFSMEEYCRRVEANSLPTALTLRFSLRQRMVYYLFWAAYGIQVAEADFERFFGVPLRKMYGVELWAARRLGFVTYQNGVYEMTPRGAFYYHYFESFYTLAYIDKIWGMLRENAFPQRMAL